MLPLRPPPSFRPPLIRPAQQIPQYKISSYFEMSKGEIEDPNDPRLIFLYQEWAKYEYSLNEYEKAKGLLRQAIQIASSHDQNKVLYPLEIQLGKICLTQGMRVDAEEALNRASAIIFSLYQTHNCEEMVPVLINQAALYKRKHQDVPVIQCLEDALATTTSLKKKIYILHKLIATDEKTV